MKLVHSKYVPYELPDYIRRAHGEAHRRDDT
jgi:hypothetical protein